MSVLEEIGALVRAPRSSASEIADWYAAKARLLEHLARETGGAEADRMRAAARHAHSLSQNRVGGLAASNAS